MLAVGQRVPEKNILLSTGTPKQKVAMLDAAKMLATKGYNLFATGRYAPFLGGEWHSEYEGVLAEREGRTAGA